MKKLQKKKFSDLEEALEGNYCKPEEKALIIKLLLQDTPLNLEQLCNAASIKPANEKWLPILFSIYDERLRFCELNKKDREKFTAYWSSQQAELYEKFPRAAAESSSKITVESLVDFLSDTSDYLFQEIANSLNIVKHTTMVAYKDLRIQESILIKNIVINTLKGAFDRSLSVEKVVKGSLNRTVIDNTGLFVPKMLEAAGMNKMSAKSSFKAAAKAFEKAEWKGVVASTISGALAPLIFSEYTSEVFKSGVIGGAEGYAKTGTLDSILEHAVLRATLRGVSYLASKSYNNDCFKRSIINTSGAGIIAATEISKAAVASYPSTSMAVVAGGVIFENLYDFIQKSEHPLALSVAGGIKSGISILKDVGGKLWDAVEDLVIMQRDGQDDPVSQKTNSNTEKVSQEKTRVSPTKEFKQKALKTIHNTQYNQNNLLRKPIGRGL